MFQIFAVLAASFFSLSEIQLRKYSTVVDILMVLPDYALKHALSVMLTTFQLNKFASMFEIDDAIAGSFLSSELKLPDYWNGAIDVLGLKSYFIYMPVVTVVLMVRKLIHIFINWKDSL